VLAVLQWVGAIRASIRHVARGAGSHIRSKVDGHRSTSSFDGTPAAARGAAATAPEATPSAASSSSSSHDAQRQVLSPPRTGHPAAGQPFPFVVPIVAKSANLVFDETSRCTKVSRCSTACLPPLMLSHGQRRDRHVPRHRPLSCRACLQGISSLQAVQALCANAFTFGPHIV